MDSRWYVRFAESGALEAYGLLDGEQAHRAEEKRKFINGETENPELDYPKIDPDLLRRKESELLELKRDVLESEADEVVKSVYRWKINEKIAELRMLLAVHAGDSHRFRRYSEFIYGRPSEDIFFYTVARLKDEARQLLDGEAMLADAAQDVLAAFEHVEGIADFDVPDEEEVERAREFNRDVLGGLAVPDTEQSHMEAGDIKEAFERALERINDEGWQVVVDVSSKTSISVDQGGKRVVVPEGRKVTVAKLRKLVAHEIGTHVARRANGERSRLMLLGLGLDRYEGGEEGVATMREQLQDKAVSDFSGFSGHLAISLALGFDGTPRDFRRVYDVLYKIFFMRKLRVLLKKDTPPEEAEQKSAEYARNMAWNRAVRTFRGTDCASPGECYTKDIVYREGNIGVWDVVRHNPDEMMRFDVGKYDPANPRHIWVLDTLGITDEDLSELGD